MECDQCSEQRARLPKPSANLAVSLYLHQRTIDSLSTGRDFNAFLFFDLSLCLTTVMDLVIPEKAEESALAIET